MAMIVGIGQTEARRPDEQSSFIFSLFVLDSYPANDERRLAGIGAGEFFPAANAESLKRVAELLYECIRGAAVAVEVVGWCSIGQKDDGGARMGRGRQDGVWGRSRDSMDYEVRWL